MNPIFQLSTRNYEKEISIVKLALADLEKECNVQNRCLIEKPFTKFDWTFFNIQFSEELAKIIEKSEMMEGALGYKIAEQMTNLLAIILKLKEVTYV